MVAERGYKNPPVFSKEKPYGRYVEEFVHDALLLNLIKRNKEKLIKSKLVSWLLGRYSYSS